MDDKQFRELISVLNKICNALLSLVIGTCGLGLILLYILLK